MGTLITRRAAAPVVPLRRIADYQPRRTAATGTWTGTVVPQVATVGDVLRLQRQVGNAAVSDLIVSRDPVPGAGKDGESRVAGSYDAISLWFPRDSAEPRQDGQVNGAGLIASAAGAIKAQLARSKDSRITIAGYASAEGGADHNRQLAAKRAARVKQLLVKAGIPADRLVDLGRGVTRSQPGLAWNRRVEVEVSLDSGLDEPAPATAAAPLKESRSYTRNEAKVMDRLQSLSFVAQQEGADGAQFATVVDGFRVALRTRMVALNEGDPLPDDLQIVMKALMLWSRDSGTQWGEGIWDSRDLTLTCAEYATVPASQNKCSSYVAEVLFQAVGSVHRVYESDDKWFPNRAADWGNAGKAIPKYPVTTSPALGDVWSNGHHVGIYLGTYNGKPLYVSARDDGDGVFALDKLQYAHGIQLKIPPPGGVFRHYTP